SHFESCEQCFSIATFCYMGARHGMADFLEHRLKFERRAHAVNQPFDQKSALARQRPHKMLWRSVVGAQQNVLNESLWGIRDPCSALEAGARPGHGAGAQSSVPAEPVPLFGYGDRGPFLGCSNRCT